MTDTNMTPPAVRLSDRQRAALLALAELRVAYGDALAGKMTEIWRETSLAAAHQAANGLDGKKLARKLYGRHRRDPIRYEITEKGLELAAEIRPEPAES